MSPIPRILHQTWKDRDIPERWQPWVRSWQEHHPDWAWRLTTDADNRAFIEQHYGWFLSIYEAYRDPIMRADAVRYFLLHHFGGVYADLDFECLRPVGPLLEGRQVVLGLEPDEHVVAIRPQAPDVKRVVCNAWMASRPGHPFWLHVIHELVAARDQRGPLDATGPVFLTRAVERYTNPDELTITPAAVLYPLTSLETRRIEPARYAELRTTAYAIHHWSGSWYTAPSWAAREYAPKIQVRVVDSGRPVAEAEVDLRLAATRWGRGAQAPKVSCLMVTKGRPELALRAITCFLRQSYTNKELVIVDDDPDATLAARVAALNEPSIRHLRLPAGDATLGELRNRSVEEAAGELVAQWDDDDLSDPMRLETQISAMLATGADACALSRHRLWWPSKVRAGYSVARVWEGSFVCKKACLPRYPAKRKGEETAAVAHVVRTRRLAVLDMPDLYVYVFHGANTFEEAHFERHWARASEAVEGGPEYRRVVEAMALRLPIDAGAVAHLPPLPELHPRPVLVERPRVSSAEQPPLLVLTPVKDAARFVDRYLEKLHGLDYDRRKISLGFLESDSVDGTGARLEAELEPLRARFGRVELHRRDFGFRPTGPRWEPSIQRVRRGNLAASRNELLCRTLENEEWVLWLDVDVADYPADLVPQLLSAGKDIVVPNCVVEPGGESFDLNTFVLDRAGLHESFWRPYIVDGLLQPPKGVGRLYLHQLRDYELTRVDAVGGTALLVRAGLHREGLVFPTFPYRYLIETEGLAMMAKDMGVACWGMPRLEVVHPPHD